MDSRRDDGLARGLTASTTRRAALRGLAGVALVAALPSDLQRATAAAAPRPRPVAGHPRLWLTAADLPRLRSWATEANPVWKDGLTVLAKAATANMDAGHVPAEDSGSERWEEYPTENYAELFAFLSLVHPDPAARQDYARRAHTLLMHVMNAAAKGPATDQPFRGPEFATSDRSRWWGEAFPLTVDWIYHELSPQDKAIIRQVFLRWIGENTNATTTSYNHPAPAGAINDPALLADPIAVRWAGNNYFAAHMRNLGLMALALDPADDSDGNLTGSVQSATGAWLYMVDHLLRGDARGGLPPEGFEYSPQEIGYVAQFLLALHTSGVDDASVWGRQVRFDGNPFWDEVVPAYLHSLSPQSVVAPGEEYRGPVYQPAWYGDGQSYWAPDAIGLFGPLGLHDAAAGNTARLAAIRWLQTETAPGGSAGLAQRVAQAADHHDAIFYFLLFDPHAPAAADPRPSLPLAHFAPGIGRLHVRTSWTAAATWFTYALGWDTIDHQHGDGNQFEFYRNGEWLTKERTGYGWNIGSSDYHNTLALENDPPAHNEPDDYRHILGQRGSQWWGEPQGDPQIRAMGVKPDYVYALGDATKLYNSAAKGATDIIHASRSILWLRPDHLVVYDRATSKTNGRFKRFWLNLPAVATVAGQVSTMTTARGQRLVVTTLLPTAAVITSEPAEPLVENGEPAQGEPMRFRLRVEAPDSPTDIRFLHILQGVDAGVPADRVQLVARGDGTPFVGAVIKRTAVLFPVDLDAEFTKLTYIVPAATSTHLITGLKPGGVYDIETQSAPSQLAVTIRPGTTARAGDDGVLRLDGLK